MSALIIVDVQNDFTKGTLSLRTAPSRANIPQTIDNINRLLADHHFDTVVYTLDYHPDDHCSFSVWPKHCVAGTWGAELDESLISIPPKSENYFLVKKGTSQSVDSYSAFIDNDRKVETELRKELLRNKITSVYVCGLALDYCVFHTAMDAAEFGFKTTIIRDCTSAYQTQDHPEFLGKMEVLSKIGIKLIDSEHF